MSQPVYQKRRRSVYEKRQKLQVFFWPEDVAKIKALAEAAGVSVSCQVESMLRMSLGPIQTSQLDVCPGEVSQ